ncbi:PRD domain-containing protein [Pediococcus siamensis]|uniref:PRD domain-containing protein n=1 Tax=Pediococcus siamensis TaxID=381829 RepID=UPI0039A1B56E
MKKSKDIIYDFVREKEYSNEEYRNGLTTKFISETLQLQRSNTSAVLNQLVHERKLKKINSRPVRYLLAEKSDNDPFSELVGANGSLKQAIQLAKAAVLYPSGNLNIQLTAQPGCGTSVFVKKIIEFAEKNKVIKQNGPKIHINCRNYANDIHSLDKKLFGEASDHSDSCFNKGTNGVIFINHYEYLDASQQAKIIDLLDTTSMYPDFSDEKNSSQKPPFLIFSCSSQNQRPIEQKVPVTITLPTLESRSLTEKLELINLFFMGEARTAGRKIVVPLEVSEAILLADYVHNVKELFTTIIMACASAYVRVVSSNEQAIQLSLDDLKPITRQGLLKVKENEAALATIFGNSETAIFDAEKDSKKSSQTIKQDLYGNINKQYTTLVDKGFSGENIKNVITEHIDRLFSKYNYYDYLDNNTNQEQLAKIVNPNIIKIVQAWLESSRKLLKRNFENSVFYGLCLHINSLLMMKTNVERISEPQSYHLIKQYPNEYKETIKLAQVLQNELNLNLSTGEIALLMMFIIEPKMKNDTGHPVLLYIMHGSATASSLMETTNSLNQNHYAFAYDMNLDVSTNIAMKEISSLIKKIDQGKGVIVIYDMGSIKTMLNAISEKVNIKIRMIQIPITLIGIDAARKSSMETDIDYVYHLITTDMRHLQEKKEHKQELIITLCHTGEGGATQLKDYIEQYSKLDMHVKALAMSNKEMLTENVMDLQKIYNIHAFVGTFNPKLFGIPFIPINKIFESSRDNLDQILMFKPILSQTYAYDRIYDYFEKQFKYVSVSLLKGTLPDLMDKLCLAYDLQEEQRIGLFVHIGSMVERNLSGEIIDSNPDTDDIIQTHDEDYKFIRKIIKNIENTFHIVVNDDEIATLIMIVRKI